MSKRKKPPANFYRMEHRQTTIRVRPLFGLKRLIRLAHRQRNGILYCDNAMSLFNSITFSASNRRTSLYTIEADVPGGAVSEPRLNVPNEATAAEMRPFHDYGTSLKCCFTPKRKQTFSVEFESYRAFDMGHRYVRWHTGQEAQVAKWEIALDVSAYLAAGYSITKPRCEYEKGEANSRGESTPRARNPRLTAANQGGGVWGWTATQVTEGMFSLAWEALRDERAHAPKGVNIEKLVLELGVNPRLAKDLHNFVMVCQYYVVGFNSFNKIAGEMMTDASVLARSIVCIEALIGTELIRRTKGKGLISVTPGGEWVLDWWSQFYMRWTPMSSPAAGSQ